MSRAAIKWGQVERFLQSRGFEIRGRGGEKMVVAPTSHTLPDPPLGRNTVMIGHKSCSGSRDEVLPCYLNKLCRHFGFTRDEIEAG